MKEIDFKKLQAPIPAELVKRLTRTSKKTGKSFTVEFVTARTVMNRLDEVCGPAGWRDEYRSVVIEGEAGVECTLYLLIDGEWVGKADLGTPSDIEGAKGSYSVALKRAGAKWGIARELYRDGVADLDGEDEPESARAPQPKQTGKEPDLNDVFPRDEDAPPIEQWITPAVKTAMVQAAKIQWPDIADNTPHIQQRIAAALGVKNWASLDTFTGTRPEAWALIQAYIPTNERQSSGN